MSRTITNMASNLANFVVSLVMGVWFTPYLVGNLGIGAYGVIPLAGTVISYLSILTLVGNAAVGRFLIIALEQGKVEEANRVFNTALMFSAACLLLLSIPCALLSLHPEKVINIAPGQLENARALFFLASVAFLVSILAGSFEVATYCRNRYDLRNAVVILATVLRVAVVVLLFQHYAPSIVHMGIGFLAGGAVSLAGAVFLWRRLTPGLRMRWVDFHWPTLRELTATGGWVAISQVGTILFLSIDLLVVNRVIGSTASGQYATMLQWSSMLRGLGMAIGGVFGPAIVAFYARGDLAGMVGYCRRSVRLVGLVMALPVGLVAGFSGSLLAVWLGEEFARWGPLLTLMTVHLCLNLGYLPLLAIYTATNKVKLPALTQLLFGGLNLFLALYLAGPVGWGMYGVAAAGAVSLSLRNLVFMPLYAAHVLKVPYDTFFGELAPLALVSALVAGASLLARTIAPIHQWGMLLLVGGATALVSIAAVALVVLRSDEKALILEFARARLRPQ